MLELCTRSGEEGFLLLKHTSIGVFVALQTTACPVHVCGTPGEF